MLMTLQLRGKLYYRLAYRMPEDLQTISMRGIVDVAALLVIRLCFNEDEVFITASRGAQFMQNMRSAVYELVKVTKNVRAANQSQK